MLILGIDTACDETAVAVVEEGRTICSNAIWTQRTVHERFGGVVPELAARRHVEIIGYVVDEALDKAGRTMAQIDAVAVNCRHGLLRSLIVGVAAAKALAFAHNKPLIGIHHIEGHIYSAALAAPDIAYPHVCLTVSGGHNLLLLVSGPTTFALLGRTLDDAAGEAFDKVAKLIGLGFPGGPKVEQAARSGNRNAIAFPRPMLDSGDLNFSFSGIKTAVVNKVRAIQAAGETPNVPDLAASFQQAVVEVLVAKTMQAAEAHGVTTVSVVGGVAANGALREQMTAAAEARGLRVVISPLALCTDNAAMIAGLAYHRLAAGERSPLSLEAVPHAPLGALGAVYT